MAKKPVVATVRSRRLAAILKEKRLARGLSVAQAAQRADLSDESVYRAEKQNCRLSPNNVKALLAVYGVTDPAEVARIVALAREAAQNGWWQAYGLTETYASFVALEAGATAKLVFEPCLVPGLLQTEGYARAVIEAGPDFLDRDQVDKLVRVRAVRQKVLYREEPLHLSAVIGEAVLHCPAGGPAVLAEQLGHLAEAAQVPSVTIRVLPAGAGAHAAMSGSFAILRYPDPADHDILYAEGLAGPVWAEEPHDLERAHRAFCRVSALALPPRESLDLITAAMRLKRCLFPIAGRQPYLRRETIGTDRDGRGRDVTGGARCSHYHAVQPCPERGGESPATAGRTATASRPAMTPAPSSSAIRRTLTGRSWRSPPGRGGCSPGSSGAYRRS